MGKSLQGWIGSYTLGTAAIEGTKFLGILGSCNLDASGVVSIASAEGDEAAPGHIVDFGGTIRKPYVKILNNRLPSAITFTVRVNGTDSACQISVAAGEEGNFIGTGEATFVSGDYIDVIIQMPATTGTATQIGGLWCEMETTGGHFGVYLSNYDHVLLGDIRTCDEKGGGVAGIDYYASGITATYFAGSNHTAELVQDVTPTTPPPSLTKVHSDHDDIAVPCEQLVRVPGTFTSGRMYFRSIDVDPATTSGTRSADFVFRKNGVDVTTMYSIASDGTPGWVDAVAGISVINDDLICYGLGCYAAPDTYTQPPGPNTRQTLDIATRSMALNFAATTDAENPLDVFIPVTWAVDYVSPDRVPRTLDGTFYSSLTQSTDAQDFTGDANSFNIVNVEIVMPSCTAIRNLRVKATGVVAGSCRVTLIVERERTAEFVLITEDGWTEYVGDDVVVPAGCRACLQFTNDGFEGIIDNVAFTQLASSDAELCVACEGNDDGDGGGGGCPDSSLSFGDLKDRVFTLCGEDPTDPVYWTEDEVGRYVNDAYVKVCRETKSLEYIEAIQLADDSSAGTLSDYVGQIFRATWDDQKIDNVTKWEIDRSVPNWEALTGLVTNYITTLQDVRTITTFQGWDGSDVTAEEHFYTDGWYTYRTWSDGTPFIADERATVLGDDGITRAYVALSGHTALTADNRPGYGTNWETYWAPLALMVWATKIPAPMTDDDWLPELKPFSHICLAYLAAATALRKYGEQRNTALADAYTSIANDYVGMLKGLTANRTPERETAMSNGWGGRRRVPIQWPPEVQS